MSTLHETLAYTAVGSPYKNVQPYDPSSTIEGMSDMIDLYYSHLTPSTMENYWERGQAQNYKILQDLDKLNIFDNLTASQKAKLDNEFNEKILPQFRAGMRDLGLVQTSSFKIGEALLYSRLMEDAEFLGPELKAKFALATWGELPKNVAIFAEQADKHEARNIDRYKDVLHYQLEVLRMAYTMNKEFTDVGQEYRVLDATWPLEMHKYMMDAIGCVAGTGGNSTTAGRSVSKAQSAVGGALSGAASGAMMGAMEGSVGGPWGAAIGGTLGLIGGLIS